MGVSLHWLANHPTPYNNALYGALAGERAIALQVHFQKLTWSSHPWREPVDDVFSWRCYHGRAGMDAHVLRQAWKGRREFFVVGGWNEPTKLGVILLRVARGFPFAVWTDTPDTRRRSLAKRYARSGLLQLVFSRAERLMVTGERGAAILRDLGCPPERIVVFPYWVPLPPVTAVPPLRGAAGSSEPVRFIGVGRIEQVKRFDVAIAALRMVVVDLGPSAARLRLVGEGSEKGLLERQVREAGLADCVEFSGWQEHRDTLRLLSESDVLIHPAEWEPYGVVVLEAMAYGRPVIASDRTMSALDRVKDGVSGFVCETGNAEQVARAMKHFILARRRIAEMGAESRKVAEAWPVSRGVEIVKEMLGTAAGREA